MIRALVTVLALLVLAIAGLATYQHLDDPNSGDGPGEAEPSQPGASHDLGSPLPSPTSSPSGDPQQIAKKFAVAFTNVQGGKQAWLDRLRPVVSGEMERGFGMTDPRQIPTDKIDQLEPVQVGDRTATTRVTYTSGLILRLTLAPNQANQWVVTRNAPVETP